VENNVITLHTNPVLPAVRRPVPHVWLPGETVRAGLLRAGVDPRQLLSVTVNDRLLEVDEWDHVCPRNGDLLHVKYEVADGGIKTDDASAARIVLAIVAVVYGYVTQDWSTAAAIFNYGNIAISVAQAVFPAKLSVANLNVANGLDQSSASPTYSLSGGSNRTRPYEPLPVVMGQHRIFPDLGAKPYTEYRGNDQYLYQVFNFGLSDCVITEVKIGDTLLGSYSDVASYWSDSNGKLPQMPGNVDSTQGASLTNSAGWITRTSGENATALALDFSYLCFDTNDLGNLQAMTVDVMIQYRMVGDQNWLPLYENQSVYYFSGASQTPQRVTYYKSVQSGQYEVRVWRSSSDAVDAMRSSAQASWDAIRTYQPDTADYTGQTRLGVIIRASGQLNGAISKLSALSSAKCSYWNGSAWVYGPTSNPAWWYLDFLRGRTNSHGTRLYGMFVPDSRIDFESIKAWALFCDAEGLTCNLVIDKEQSQTDTLTVICRCGFASWTESTGKYGVIWDVRNASPVAVFGMGNIIKDSFSVQYVGSGNLADEFVVSYVNAETWETEQVRKTVPGTVGTPVKPTTVDLMGCTSKAMAGKFANYLAAQNKYRKRQVSFDVDFEGFLCQRGDVILVSHDLTQWGTSGRIIAVAGNTVTLEKPVALSSAGDYLLFERPDGQMTTYSVPAGSGTTDVLTLSAAPELQSGMLPEDHRFIFSPLATPGKRMKIISISPSSDARMTIVAVDEFEEFYAAWDGDFEEVRQQSQLVDQTPKITGLSITEKLARSDSGRVIASVAVTWMQAGASCDNVSLRWRVNDGNWDSARVSALQYEFELAQPGRLEVVAQPFNGLISGAPQTATKLVYGLSLPPGGVQNLGDFFRAGRTVLTWDAVADVRAVDYEIRLGPSWESGAVLGVVAAREFSATQNGTYWIKARATNAYSQNAAAITIAGAALVQNVVASYDEDTLGWPGTTSGGCAVFDGNLALIGAGNILAVEDFLAISDMFFYGGVADSGGYELGNVVDIGRVAPCAVSISYQAQAVPVDENILAVDDFLAITDFFHEALGRVIQIQPQIAIAQGDGVFGAWRNFAPGSYVGQHFKARLLLFSSDTNVTAVVTALQFTVDVPDRLDTYTVDTSAAAALSLPFSAPFNGGPGAAEIPAVQGTILNAQQGDDLVISAATATGIASVAVKNSGAFVVRRVQIQVQGY
jgi:hypothetical protein